MLQKIERISIFDESTDDFLMEAPGIPEFAQSAGGTFSPKAMKSVSNLTGIADFKKRRKGGNPPNNTWKFAVNQWLDENGANMLNNVSVKRVVNEILQNDFGPNVIKDGDRVSNYYRYDSHQVIYNDTKKQNYYYIYKPTKNKKFYILIFIWKADWDYLVKYDFPIASYGVWYSKTEAALPGLMEFLLQNEKNGSAYKKK